MTMTIQELAARFGVTFLASQCRCSTLQIREIIEGKRTSGVIFDRVKTWTETDLETKVVAWKARNRKRHPNEGGQLEQLDPLERDLLVQRGSLSRIARDLRISLPTAKRLLSQGASKAVISRARAYLQAGHVTPEVREAGEIARNAYDLNPLSHHTQQALARLFDLVT